MRVNGMDVVVAVAGELLSHVGGNSSIGQARYERVVQTVKAEITDVTAGPFPLVQNRRAFFGINLSAADRRNVF